MKIFIAADHGGFYLKEELKSYLHNKGYRVDDFGNAKYDPQDDYPDFIIPLGEAVAKDKSSFGIVIGRSGIGEAIIANKVKGVYAALCLNTLLAKKAREHNGANIISLGADFLSPTSAKRIVEEFLHLPYPRAARHKRRIAKIAKYESAHLRQS